MDHGPDFCTYTGRPLRYSNAARECKALLQRAGLPKIRFHDLRHTAASMMLTGRSLHEVSRVLGNAHITLTTNTYRHVLPDECTAAAQIKALLM